MKKEESAKPKARNKRHHHKKKKEKEKEEEMVSSGVICEMSCFLLNSSSPASKSSEIFIPRSNKVLLGNTTHMGRASSSSTTTTTITATSAMARGLKMDSYGFGGVSGSGYCRFRTKAAVNDGFVLTEMEKLSFYQLLGIPESGTSSEIKQAYKQLARKYHPDVSPPDRTEEYTRRFIMVQEAYETLSDPTRRALYDRDLSRGLHLAFSARKRYGHHRYGQSDDQDLAASTEWRSRWQDQLAGLKRKSKNNESSGNTSWAARMRRQREESLGQHQVT